MLPNDVDPVFDAFSTVLRLENPEADKELEINRLWERQRAIDDLLAGTLPIDYVEAMLAEHGIDPYQWADEGEQNLIWTLSQCPGLT